MASISRDTGATEISPATSLTERASEDGDGCVHRPSCLDAAREALRLAVASPAEAVALASATVRRARRQGDATARAVAAFLE